MKSERKYIGDYDEIEYPIGYISRKGQHNGTIKVHGAVIRIGYAFKGYQLGLKPIADADGVYAYDVFLCDFPLGKLDIKTGCFSQFDEVK